MSTTLTDKFVIIRKEHRCFSCFRKFQIKTKMWYWSGIYEGDFGSVYSCLTCHDIMDLLPPDYPEEGWPEGFVHEMLNKDQTPEQLLDQLKIEKTKSKTPSHE